MESAQSAQVSAPNAQLVSSQRYFVRVQVETPSEQSAWSSAATFVTALLGGADAADGWRAPFVSAETDDSYKQCSKGTLVRGTFTVKKPLQAAWAHTTALGLYEFYCNGARANDDEMAPGWTSYAHHLLYQTTDVTQHLHEGENVAGAMLGAGWYKGVMGLTKARNNYGDTAAFAMQLVLCYRDGTRETVTTRCTRRATRPAGAAPCSSPEFRAKRRKFRTGARRCTRRARGAPCAPWHRTHLFCARRQARMCA